MIKCFLPILGVRVLRENLEKMKQICGPRSVFELASTEGPSGKRMIKCFLPTVGVRVPREKKKQIDGPRSAFELNLEGKKRNVSKRISDEENFDINIKCGSFFSQNIYMHI